jgi:hypothetical protein
MSENTKDVLIQIGYVIFFAGLMIIFCMMAFSE